MCCSLTGGSLVDGDNHAPNTTCSSVGTGPVPSLPTVHPAPPPPPAGKYARAIRQHTFPKGAKDKDKGRSKVGGAGRHNSQVMVPDLIDLTLGSASPIDDLNLLPSSTQSGKNAKQVPGLENGFLVQVSTNQILLKFGNYQSFTKLQFHNYSERV